MLYKKIKFLLLFIISSLIPFQKDLLYPVSAETKKITIVYTNSLNGRLDYCRCKENPNGGLVKRATEIKKIREKYGSIFLFETGDFFSYEPDYILAFYIAKAYSLMSYDAVLFGDQEFTIGTEKFLEFRKILPFICNNLYIKRGNRFRKVFQRYIVKTIDNVKVGVIGTIAPEAFKLYSKKLTGQLRILNQIREIKKDIRALKKIKVDLIILLSHSGYEIEKKLQKSLKGLHVIIGGHSQTLIKKPVVENNSILVQAGADGARIGILRLSLKGGRISLIGNSFRHPDENQPEDDVEIRRLINNYREKAKEALKNIRFK